MAKIEPGMEAMLDMYFYETNSLLEQLDEILLRTEQANSFDSEDIKEIFRIMHTIKGSSAMMGFENLSVLAHKAEDMFFVIRENPNVITDVSFVYDLVFQVSDSYKAQIENIQNNVGGEYELIDFSELIDKLLKARDTLLGETKGEAVPGPNCRLRFGAGQNFGQPVQPVQPMVQPTAQKAGFSLNTITGNPMIMMVIKLALGAISLWAAFGPLLKFIGKGLVSFSFMEVYTMTSMAGGKAASAALAGYFVPLLIMMILAILLALAGIALTILPKVAPQVKLPLPSCASYAATAFALILAIISDFITIGFTATAKVPFTGFGVFMIILSFLALAGTVFMSYVELKKK